MGAGPMRTLSPAVDAPSDHDRADATWARGDVLPAELRATAGAFPTGVTIVSTRQGGQPIGMTVSSFTSVSLDPPLVLVCLARRAAALRAFRVGSPVGISILATGQTGVALSFLRPLEERFDGVAIHDGPGDVPLIEGAAAWLAGEVARIYDGGDHEILLIRPHSVSRSAAPPLLYHSGSMTDWITQGGTP